jgi:N-acetyl-gamma-glutamyl-phosphate reductase
MTQVAILGASGYTGAELVRLIAGHPTFRIAALAAERRAGMPMAEVYPHLRHLDLPRLVRIAEVDFDAVDLFFCALPHATSQEVVAGLPRDKPVVDLSADFRLRDPASYERWYGHPHAAPDLQAEAAYGLTEFYRDEIARARLVACTGCNVATGLFALLPPLMAGAIDPDDIVLDLKCGPSGAGRSVKEHLLLAEAGEGASAYGVGGTHRHVSEFDQELSRVASREVRIRFTPHLVPMNRGILATGYVAGDPDAIHAALAERYACEPFLHVLPMGRVPATQHVRGSNLVHVGVVADRIAGRATIVAALDNLTKGSSGMAIQNANIVTGQEETAGLGLVPLFP